MLGYSRRSRKNHAPHWGDVVFGVGLALFSVVMIVESVNGVVFGGLIGTPRRVATPLELWSWRVFWAFFGLLAMFGATTTWRELRARRGSL